MSSFIAPKKESPPVAIPEPIATPIETSEGVGGKTKKRKKKAFASALLRESPHLAQAGLLGI